MFQDGDQNKRTTRLTSKYSNHYSFSMLTQAGCGDLETDLFEKFNIQTSIFLVRGRPYIRLSTAVYNDMTDYVKLGEAVTQLTTDTRKAVKLNKGYQLPLMHWDLTPIVSVNKDQD